MPTPGHTPGRHDAPSEYVRLEAQMASASEHDEPASARLGTSEPLVLVAEADPGLRAWVALGLTEHGTADDDAFRVESVATAEHLIECLQREKAAIVLCGHLVPPADWSVLLDRLQAAAAEQWVLVDHAGNGRGDALQTPSQAVRLAEAVTRLLHRTPGRSTSDPTLPTTL